MHPSLGGGFGPGFKVAGGRDIVGDKYTGAAFFPDNDPYDCVGHGTHVAGIIGAEDKDFVGVAPKATLRSYKVFGCGFAETGDDALIQAFVQAYEDGADVINASIGGPGGWPEDAWAAAASRIAEQGVFIAISAGNSGDEGVWYPSSGDMGNAVTAVASITTEQYITMATVAEGGNGVKRSIGYLDNNIGKSFPQGGSFPIYILSGDKTNPTDGCFPLPDDTPDLSGYIVLVRRGTCTFQTKENNVVIWGAKYVWFYNTPNVPDLYPTITSSVSKAYAMIPAGDGEWIVDQFNAGGNVTITFPDSPVAAGIDNNVTGGKLSTFTTWGPSFEAQIKSEIAAPGGLIYSTYPLNRGGYSILSGTSMASPYIAGVAALYMAANGGRAAMGGEGVAELKRKILTSGTLINWNDGINPTDWTKLAPVAQQGAGYVNAMKVLTYVTSTTPGKLELNDTAYFKGDHYINIKNSGKKEADYYITHEPAATINSFEPGFVTPQIFPGTFIDATASVKFTQTKVNVRPGTTNSFKVSFTPPAVESTLFPIYSGKIVISGTNGEVLSIPYMGIVGKLYDVKSWDLDGGWPLIVNDIDGSEITGPANFTLGSPNRPAVAMVNNFGSAEIRWDIVEENWALHDWHYPPVPGKNSFVGSVVTRNQGLEFPIKFQPRNGPLEESWYNYYDWEGALADGTKIKPGKYRFLIQSLKVTGLKERNQDWQRKLSGVITIQPAEI